MEPLSVLLPAYNEAESISETVDKIRETLGAEAIPHEIIVINDGSTDETKNILAKLKDIRVITHPMNAGYGKSLKDGIKEAKHEWILIMDADGTYPVHQIMDLYRELGGGFDMVVGARTGKHYRGNFIKAPARVVFRWLCEFATGRKIPDINSGLRIFKKNMALELFQTLCNGFSFTTTITLAAFLSGYSVIYRNVDYNERRGESKVRYFRDTLRTAQIIVEAILYYNPIKMFISMGMVLFVLSVLLAGVSVLFGADSLYAIALIFLCNAILSVLLGMVAVTIRQRR